ncbi:hypothetical protein [Pseudovibrio sp. POLY-S9]|uniref:hypothetical protein n=1 Tax=Pseudovibrio sp. POLY-S9 TaxID=1576596 RepID=UPI0007104F97|nr:hypothetical protein [Pseudovibrio sp. POLY-S9]
MAVKILSVGRDGKVIRRSTGRIAQSKIGSQLSGHVSVHVERAGRVADEITNTRSTMNKRYGVVTRKMK